MKKYQVKHFTLIELLAAMAVFSVLLLISLRLFSGAQQLWLRSEQKTDTFASARTAMEFMASRLQTLSYIDDEPFLLDDSPANDFEQDSVWFISTVSDSGKYDTHFRQFMLKDPRSSDDDAGTLYMLEYNGQEGSRRNNYYGQLFPPYKSTGRHRFITSRLEAMTHIRGVFNSLATCSDESIPNGQKRIAVVENVVGLRFIRYTDNSGTLTRRSNTSTTTAARVGAAPYLLEIELKMMDSKESFQRWQDASSDADKNAVFAEYGYTFNRGVLLGKKGNI